MAFKRRKVKREPWRVSSVTTEELAKEKRKPEGQDTPRLEPPLKRPTIGDVMITKEEQ